MAARPQSLGFALSDLRCPGVAAAALASTLLVLRAVDVPWGLGEAGFALVVFLGFSVAAAVRFRTGSYADRLDIDGDAVVFDGIASAEGGVFGPRIERALVREIVIRGPGEWDAPRLAFVDHRGEVFAHSDGAGHTRRRLAAFFRANGFSVVTRTWTHVLVARPADAVAWARRRLRTASHRGSPGDWVHRIRLHAGIDRVSFGASRVAVRGRFSCEEVTGGPGAPRADRSIDAGLLLVYDDEDGVAQIEIRRPASAELDGHELLGLPFAAAQATVAELGYETTNDGEDHLALGTLGLSLFADNGVIARVRLERASHPTPLGVPLSPSS